MFTLPAAIGLWLLSGVSLGAGDAAPAQAAAPTPAHLARRAPDGFFYLDARVGATPMRFLVDTGASTTVLTRADARRLRLEISGGATMMTAGGRVPVGRARIANLSIGARRLAPVRVVVADDGVGASLIGQDVLARFASLRIEGDRLALD